MSKLKQLLFSLNETDRRVIEEKLKEKYQQIDQLKQQLAEKDFIIKNLNHSLSVAPNANAGQRARIDELTKIVKEKDKEINYLIADYEKRISQEQELMSNMEHRLVEKQNKIEEISKEFVQVVHKVYDWRVLCAEKDKEIETMKKDSDKNIDYLVEFASLIENEKDCNRMLKALDRVKSGNKYIIDKANQSKTEFAIQELEKVKEEMDLNGNSYCEIRQGTSPHNPTDYAWFNYVKFRNYLNQQIKELKGD